MMAASAQQATQQQRDEAARASLTSCRYVVSSKWHNALIIEGLMPFYVLMRASREQPISGIDDG